MPVLRDRHVSRVHALVIRIRNVVHLVDAASTNGVDRRAAPVRHLPLTEGCPVALASGLAFVSWSDPLTARRSGPAAHLLKWEPLEPVLEPVVLGFTPDRPQADRDV